MLSSHITLDLHSARLNKLSSLGLLMNTQILYHPSDFSLNLFLLFLDKVETVLLVRAFQSSVHQCYQILHPSKNSLLDAPLIIQLVHHLPKTNLYTQIHTLFISSQ